MNNSPGTGRGLEAIKPNPDEPSGLPGGGKREVSPLPGLLTTSQRLQSLRVLRPESKPDTTSPLINTSSPRAKPNHC